MIQSSGIAFTGMTINISKMENNSGMGMRTVPKPKCVNLVLICG